MPTSVYVRKRIAAPPERLWAILSDIEQAMVWNRAWASVKFLTQQHEDVGTRFRAETEGGASGEFEVVNWAPGEHIAFAARPGERQEGLWLTVEEHAVYLRPAGGGEETEVTMAARARGHGFRGWLVSKLVWPGYQRRGLREVLEGLAELAAPTEDPTRGDEEDEWDQDSSGPLS